MVSHKVTVSFDSEANAVYYKLRGGRVAKTKEAKMKSLDFLLDYDREGRLLGVEVLNMKKALELAVSKMGLFFIPKVSALATRSR